MNGWFGLTLELAAWGLSAAALAAAIVATVHVLLTQRDPRAAVAWLGFVWMVPLVGCALYLLLGINRIQRRAQKVRRRRLKHLRRAGREPLVASLVGRDDVGDDPSRVGPRNLALLAGLTGRVTGWPLREQNRITVFEHGGEAYQPMLASVRSARRSVTLASYIFNVDEIGRAFASELARAHARGVAVRVLVDAVGTRYSDVRIDRILAEKGVPVARFLPMLLGRLRYFNLRNHRKVLVIDGVEAYTGGMNIRLETSRPPDDPDGIVDVHFHVRGPIVSDLQVIFAEDWETTTGERLEGPPWFAEPDAIERDAAERDAAEPAPAADACARLIPTGPDGDIGKLERVLIGAIHAAQERVAILTPYFLPDPPILRALEGAAMMGVRVDLVLPDRPDVKAMRYASNDVYQDLVRAGCHLWMTPPPFDHGKLMVVDGAWTLLGSSNWDARSLRLNFELDVECYDPATARACLAVIEGRIARARALP